jgi:hypothetical protein
MLNNLPQHSPITTTNDQDSLWIWVRVQCQMGYHLLVCKLVSFGALDGIVENEYGAVVGGFEDQDILVFALLVVEDVLDLQSHCLTRPKVIDLAEPSVCDELYCQLPCVTLGLANLG